MGWGEGAGKGFGWGGGGGKEFWKVTGLFKTAAENVLGRDVRTQRRELRYLSLAPDKQQRTAAVCRLSRYWPL